MPSKVVFVALFATLLTAAVLLITISSMVVFINRNKERVVANTQTPGNTNESITTNSSTQTATPTLSPYPSNSNIATLVPSEQAPTTPPAASTSAAQTLPPVSVPPYADQTFPPVRTTPLWPLPTPVMTYNGLPNWTVGALTGPLNFDTAATAGTAVASRLAEHCTACDADTGPTWMNSTQWQTYLQQASTVAAAGHNGGLPIVWYFPSLEVVTDGGETGPSYGKDHPDQVQVSLSGLKNIFYGGVVFWIPPGTESAWMQPTGPWRDVFIGRMKELTAAGVDGIWADVPQYADLSHEWNGIGQYDSAAFLQATGMSPPTKFDMQDPSFRRWLVWRHEAIRDLLRDTATGIQQTRNDTFLVVEVLPQDYQDATQTGLDASYLRVLPNVMVVWEIDFMSETHSNLLALEDDWISLIAMYKYSRGASGNKPSWTFSYGRNVDDAKGTLSLALATGNSPYEVKTPQKGDSVNSTWRQSAYAWASQYKTTLMQAKRSSLANVAVLHSSSSRDFATTAAYGSGMFCTVSAPPSPDGVALSWWATDPSYSCYNQEYVAEFRGVIKALVHEHIPFDVVTSYGLNVSDLDGKSILFAPLLISLSIAEAEVIRSWVNNGGVIVMTGPDPTLLNEFGVTQPNYIFSDLLGFSYNDTWKPARVLRPYGAGHVVWTPNRSGQTYMQSRFSNASLDEIISPIMTFGPPPIRLVGQHRCIHTELTFAPNQFVVQLHNFVGVCEMNWTQRGNTFPVIPQTTVTIELDLPTNVTVSAVQSSDFEISPPTLSSVPFSVDNTTNTLKMTLAKLSYYLLIIVNVQ